MRTLVDTTVMIAKDGSVKIHGLVRNVQMIIVLIVMTGISVTNVVLDSLQDQIKRAVSQSSKTGLEFLNRFSLSALQTMLENGSVPAVVTSCTLTPRQRSACLAMKSMAASTAIARWDARNARKDSLQRRTDVRQLRSHSVPDLVRVATISAISVCLTMLLPTPTRSVWTVEALHLAAWLVRSTRPVNHPGAPYVWKE